MPMQTRRNNVIKRHVCIEEDTPSIPNGRKKPKQRRLNKEFDKKLRTNEKAATSKGKNVVSVSSLLETSDEKKKNASTNLPQDCLLSPDNERPSTSTKVSKVQPPDSTSPQMKEDSNVGHEKIGPLSKKILKENGSSSENIAEEKNMKKSDDDQLLPHNNDVISNDYSEPITSQQNNGVISNDYSESITSQNNDVISNDCPPKPITSQQNSDVISNDYPPEPITSQADDHMTTVEDDYQRKYFQLLNAMNDLQEKFLLSQNDFEDLIEARESFIQELKCELCNKQEELILFEQKLENRNSRIMELEQEKLNYENQLKNMKMKDEIWEKKETQYKDQTTRYKEHQQIITTQQEILDFYNLLCGIKVEKLADDGTERLSNSTIDENIVVL